MQQYGTLAVKGGPNEWQKHTFRGYWIPESHVEKNCLLNRKNHVGLLQEQNINLYCINQLKCWALFHAAASIFKKITYILIPLQFP